jgi:Tfp pilus assembly major pilin PilA
MRIAALGLALLVSLNAAAATHPGMPKQWTGELPVAPAFLHRQLPPNIAAYARVPNLLGLLTMPKGSQLDAALRSDANIANVRAIQNGLAQNVLSLPALSDPRLKFLADAVRSPIEVAAFGIPNPALLIGATLKARTKTEFNRLFDNLGRGGPPVRLAAPLDTQGISELMGLPVPVFVKFDPTTGRLLLFAAQRLDRLEFEQFLGDLPKEVKDHPMYALEQKIDASGQGLFLWVNASQLLPLVQARSPGIAQTLGRLGLGGMRAVAFGFGTANGKGRLSLVVDAGDDDAKRPFPVVANNVTATAVGTPDAAVLFSVPRKAEFDRLESMWDGRSSTESRGGWEKFKARFRDLIGVNIGELFAAIGPDIVILFDQAGDYTAVHLRDPVLFDDLVRRIAAKIGSAPDERIIGGTTFHHWRLPALLGLTASAGTAIQTAQGKSIAALLGKLHNHVYWIHEGEYLYVASAPQPLIDRVHKGATTHVATWLATRQRMDTSTSLLAATASVAKLPRRTYDAYLSLLQSIADVTDSKVDIWSMPTADQLALPRNGAVGVSLNFGERYISLQLTYGDHPGELLLGSGGFGTVAAVGIIAAIAIPAYQDYTIRAQVTEGLNLAKPAEFAIAASFATRGILPTDRSAAGLASSTEVPTARYIERLEVSGGVITMTFGKASNAAIRGKTLALTPVTTTGRDIEWRCGYATLPAGARPLVPDDSGASAGTTIPSKYLPSMCR